MNYNDYDANERNHYLCCGMDCGDCLIVKHIDVKWAINDDLTVFRNIHFLIICLNDAVSLKTFDELLRFDHLNEQNGNRFPVECRMLSKLVSFLC